MLPKVHCITNSVIIYLLSRNLTYVLPFQPCNTSVFCRFASLLDFRADHFIVMIMPSKELVLSVWSLILTNDIPCRVLPFIMIRLWQGRDVKLNVICYNCVRLSGGYISCEAMYTFCVKEATQFACIKLASSLGARLGVGRLQCRPPNEPHWLYLRHGGPLPLRRD